MASKRGFGVCMSCKKEYSNRKKPKFCHCGYELGGSFVEATEKPSPPSSSVVVFSSPLTGTLSSVKLTPNDDRQFLLSKENNVICFAHKCLELRGAYNASNQIEKFHCKHADFIPEEPIYKISFTKEEIENFTPDKNIQEEMKMQQETKLSEIPTVVKLTNKVFAVVGPVTTTETMSYSHVRCEEGDGGIETLKCMATGCRKKSSKTKQITHKRICIHMHYVLLARQLKENVTSGSVDPFDSNVEISPKSRFLSQAASLALKIQMARKIPYVIPFNIVCFSDTMILDESIPSFEPTDQTCYLCKLALSSPLFPQGCSSTNGNGILITNKYPFKKINIKLKKCLSLTCGAINVLFPYDQGLFNVCNKVLVGIDILLEWRQYLKAGLPVTNIIQSKLKALELKTDKVNHLSVTEFDYVLDVLYNGFYGFEAMSERNLNSVICGYCGIAGKNYFGDGNEKNCCSLSNVNLEKGCEGATEKSFEYKREDWLGSFIDDIRFHLLERSTFAKSKLRFRVSVENIPPLIPSLMRKAEMNTEVEKQSIYLKNNERILKGDAMVLSQILRRKKISISDVDCMNYEALLKLAKDCNIDYQKKSTDFLRMEIKQLYASILIGTSPCHEFIKSPGHTGGFYHVVCPHGTTVCSKFMMLAESVRDAADLWLSLKYPPVMFICDTPCTFVHHINNRDPEAAAQYWGNHDGCFEIPEMGKVPSKNMNVPYVTPAEFESSNGSINDDIPYIHPLTGQKQRFVCGDRFHSQVSPHKSPLCAFHDINLCKQASTIKTSYQESMNSRKNRKRNRSACTQDILHHIFYNYIMNFYENEDVVTSQERALQDKSVEVSRDRLMRFIF